MNQDPQEILKLRKNKIEQGGGEKAIEKQHAQGKLTARERIDILLDKDSFEETDIFVTHQEHNFGMESKELPGDGVITGTGTIMGRPVCIFAQDFTVMGGAAGLMHERKIVKIMEIAMKMRIPIIGLNDSGGARIQEGVNSQAGYGEIFRLNTLLSGVVPQISIILGPCAGGAAYSPALTDFVFVVDKISSMFLTGPAVIKSVIGEEITQEELGGARVLSEISGNAHVFCENETECFAKVRELLGFLPQNNEEKAERVVIEDTKTTDPGKFIPSDHSQPYDVRDIITSICDGGSFYEIQELYAPNIVTGFGRINGESVGFVANQPLYLAGVLDCDSADKASRFIMTCDAYNIPIITLEDMPGCLPGVDQEHAGVVRHGAKMLYAYSQATVAKITIILRKAYGGGYVAMNSRHIGADLVYAWPDTEIAVMGPSSAVNIIYRKELAAAEDPQKLRMEKIQEYKDTIANPYAAASKGYIDGIINPCDTRKVLIKALNLCKNKKEERLNKKHGLPPA